MRTETRPSVARVSGWAERRGQFRGFLLIALTVGTFLLLFRTIDRSAVLHSLQGIAPPYWIAALLLTVSFPIFSALRWHLTLRAIGHRVPFWRCLTIILGVSPISAIAPSKAGDLLKAIAFRREIGILEVGGTVLTERALDILTLAVLALAGGLVTGHALITRLAAAVSGLGLTGLLLLPIIVASIQRATLREKLERVIRTLHTLRSRPALLGGILFFTAINWLASVVQTHLLLSAVGASVPFSLTLASLPMAIFVGLLPITIGGMGTRDAALVVLLSPAATPAQALAVGLLYSFFGYWLLALLGFPFLHAALFKHPANEAPRPYGRGIS